ncbi:MAG: hypothetical protein ACO375_00005 [Candidatus Nanopelagicaceae bacterium]
MTTLGASVDSGLVDEVSTVPVSIGTGFTIEVALSEEVEVRVST